MRDAETYRLFNACMDFAKRVAGSLQAAITGESIQNQAFKNLLLEKGLITEEEFTKAVGKVIEDINSGKMEEKIKKEIEEKQKKTELLKPTQTEVNTVENTKNEQK